MSHPSAVTSSSQTALPVIGKVSAAISTARAVQELVKDVHRRWQSRSEYVSSIDSTDDAYHLVLTAVLDRLPTVGQRAVEMVTGRGGAVADHPSSSGSDRTVRWVYDGARQSVLSIGGHRIEVALTDAETQQRGEGYTLRRRQVRFTSSSIAARDALHDWLTSIVATARAQRPALRMAGRWGGWEHRGDVPQRDLDTVILDGDQKEQLIGDLDRFLASEADYARLGVPFHRGYLLYGPPGTGKTSMVKAIAAHFALPLFYLPLSDMSAT